MKAWLRSLMHKLQLFCLHFMWPLSFLVLKDILFYHKHAQPRSTENFSPYYCQSSCARVPSESRAHFNIYWNVIKTTQSDSWQSMLFRLWAAEAGLPTLTTIVCLHAVYPRPSEEKVLESHLCNSSLKGTIRLRLHVHRPQCVLIDRAYILHRERSGGTW